MCPDKKIIVGRLVSEHVAALQAMGDVDRVSMMATTATPNWNNLRANREISRQFQSERDTMLVYSKDIDVKGAF